MADFTKRYMIATAKIIWSVGDNNTRAHLANEFGRMFAADNPRFDWARWETACLRGAIQERPGSKLRPIAGAGELGLQVQTAVKQLGKER